jgi:hypothetical protein
MMNMMLRNKLETVNLSLDNLVVILSMMDGEFY